MDTVSKEKRGEMMSKIKSRDTVMERAVRPVLEALGFEYHPVGLPGKPDFAHRGLRVAVFLDGCFWHMCPEHCRMPKTNRDFWLRKLTRNRSRDRDVDEILQSDGWMVLRVWEHDLRELAKNERKRKRMEENGR